MTTYQITSSAGVEMGLYQGGSPQEALDALAREAGYCGREEAARVAGPFEGTVEVVIPVALDSGREIASLSDGDVQVLARQAWGACQGDDLRALRAEAKRRGIRCV